MTPGSPNRVSFLPWFFTHALLLAWLGAAQAEEFPVLELDGAGSYLELPPDMFDGLTEATVEGWAKWDRFGLGDGMFFCFGPQHQAMFMCNHGLSGVAKFVIYDKNAARWGTQSYSSTPTLHLNQWRHIEAVYGTGWVRVLVIGVMTE